MFSEKQLPPWPSSALLQTHPRRCRLLVLVLVMATTLTIESSNHNCSNGTTAVAVPVPIIAAATVGTAKNASMRMRPNKPRRKQRSWWRRGCETKGDGMPRRRLQLVLLASEMKKDLCFYM